MQHRDIDARRSVPNWQILNTTT